MRIRFKREELLQPLSHVVGVVERRQTLPILSYVLLSASDDGVTLTGTDLEVEISARVSSLAGAKGNMTLPARKLFDICRALPEGSEIDILSDGEKAQLKAGRSRFALLTLPASDFPSIPASEWELSLTLPQYSVKTAIEQTHFCMAQQDVRYYLNGLLFEFSSSKLRVVATDGHRLALTELSIEGYEGVIKQVILPRKGIIELSRILSDDGELKLKCGSNHLRVEMDGIVFTTKLIDGRYPDYNRVIPPQRPDAVRLERQRFREALSRVAILSTEKYRGVRLNVEGELMTITAHNPEQEEAQEEINVQYKGAPLEVGFNVAYLIDAVSALKSDEILFSLTDPNSSSLLHGADALYPQYVIMPMRL
jgi:DNA polymerase-3 subunit beta